MPHAAVRVIAPDRAMPGFSRTKTFILLLLVPFGGETVTQDKDSVTDQVEFEEIFTN